MKDTFTSVAAPDTAEASRQAAIQLLTELQCRFTPQADGYLFVTGSINLGGRNLETLPDLSMVDVESEFFCDGNNLQNLRGAPRSVGGEFDCSKNALTSLEGAPAAATTFYCDKNPRLEFLEHAPAAFSSLVSDLGVFNDWRDVPERIRFSPENYEKVIVAKTVLGAALRVAKPLRFKA